MSWLDGLLTCQTSPFLFCSSLHPALCSRSCGLSDPHCRHSCGHRQRSAEIAAALGRPPQRSVNFCGCSFHRDACQSLPSSAAISANPCQASPLYLPIAAKPYRHNYRSLPSPTWMSADRCQPLHRSLPIAADRCRALPIPANACRSLQRYLSPSLPIATDRCRSRLLTLIHSC